MFDPERDQNPACDEIRALITGYGWPERSIPEFQIADCYRKYFQNERQKLPGITAGSVQAKFSSHFGMKPAWAGKYAVFIRATPQVREKIATPEGNLRLKLADTIDLLRDPRCEAIVEEAFLSAQGNETWFLNSIKKLAKARHFQKFDRSAAHAAAEARKAQVPKPTQPPVQKMAPQPEPEEPPIEAAEAERLRKIFALGSYRPPPRKVDLPPISQPKGWDPDKVARVEKGSRVYDN